LSEKFSDQQDVVHNGAISDKRHTKDKPFLLWNQELFFPLADFYAKNRVNSPHTKAIDFSVEITPLGYILG